MKALKIVIVEKFFEGKVNDIYIWWWMLLTVEAPDSFGAVEVLLVRVVLFFESPFFFFLSILHDYLQKIQALFTLLDLF
jgi:hypothetical protein